jgi:hypothetical protein
MDNHSSLLQKLVNYGCKKFYNIGPRSRELLHLEAKDIGHLGRDDVEGSSSCKTTDQRFREQGAQNTKLQQAHHDLRPML